MPDLLLSPICCCQPVGNPCEEGFGPEVTGIAELWYPVVTAGSSSTGQRSSLILDDFNNNIEHPLTGWTATNGLGPNQRWWEFIVSESHLLRCTSNIIDVTGEFTLSFWVELTSTGSASILGLPYSIGSLTNSGGTNLFFNVQHNPNTDQATVSLGIDSGDCDYQTTLAAFNILADFRLFCCYRYRDIDRRLRLSVGNISGQLSHRTHTLQFHMEPSPTNVLAFGSTSPTFGQNSDAFLDQINICASDVADSQVALWWNNGSGQTSVSCA